MKLKEENAYFASIREGLLSEHGGQFVLIKGKHLVGFFPDAEAAFEAGAAKFGAEDFLVTQLGSKTDISLSPLLSTKRRVA